MSTNHETKRRRSAPRFSISQISTLAASFDDDLAAYRAAGLDGIGIWELKLPENGDDTAALEAFVRSGLESASAVPVVPSILPLPLLGGPTDPQERIDAFCASIHRLAAFGASGHRLPDRHRPRPRPRPGPRDRRRRAFARSPRRRSSPA